MPNINLNLATENMNEYKPKIFNGSLVFSIAIIVLMLAIYGGLLFYRNKLNSDIKKTQAEYGLAKTEFMSDSTGQVVDFVNRSEIAGKFLDSDQSALEIISKLEEAMLPNVYLTSLQYDKKTKTVTLACVGDNFGTVAKQVLSFKQNKYFSAVIPGTSAVDPQDGKKLNFEVDLKLN